MSKPTHNAISIRNLSICYGRQAALQDVNLDIPAKKITALVGPSGCGKSSFLSSLNRLTDLIPGCEVKGEILFGDEEVNLLEQRIDTLALRRKMGMVFQKPNPFPQSIRRNFEIPLREIGMSKKEILPVMERCLKDVGLWGEVENRLDQSATNLSGGQQQRLCIARALSLEPEVILFDEPCSALDPIASGIVEDHIAALRGRVTVVIVTHNLAQARRIADHLAIFWIKNDAGTIVEHGPAEPLFREPQVPEAALYLSGDRG